jgi:hypothetical protein
MSAEIKKDLLAIRRRKCLEARLVDGSIDAGLPKLRGHDQLR